MKQTKYLMGMHITVEVNDEKVQEADLKEVYDYFTYVDTTFSTYKHTSEISLINTGRITSEQYSQDMREVLAFCEKTKQESHGYFDIQHDGKLDPSGLVKGWSVRNAAFLLKKKGFHNYFIDAGGDIQTAGKNSRNDVWTVGIRNPFLKDQIVKVLSVSGFGVATSGNYERGQHIYNPHKRHQALQQVVSLTVIGPDVYEADRFATAAFAMGKEGIHFIASLPGFACYMIEENGTATYTKNFEQFIVTL